MQIIIVGCGKVGRTLAEQLQEEESDITLIDVSSNVITSLQDDIDAMGIVGNGARRLPVSAILSMPKRSASSRSVWVLL